MISPNHEPSREHFLARCATAYDMGLVSVESLRLLERWIDFVLRFEGGQHYYVADFLATETDRTNHFQRGLRCPPYRPLKPERTSAEMLPVGALPRVRWTSEPSDPWAPRGVWPRDVETRPRSGTCPSPTGRAGRPWAAGILEEGETSMPEDSSTHPPPPQTCPPCNGTGVQHHVDSDPKKPTVRCSGCGGRGWTYPKVWL